MKKLFIWILCGLLVQASAYGGELDLSGGHFNDEIEEYLAHRSDEELAKITHLNLANNNLTKIPAILERMPNLVEIDFRFNDIDSFEGLPKLDKLRKLDLQDNDISSFEGLPNLQNLEELYLGRNRISSFEGLPKLDRLKKLDVDSYPSKSNLNSLKGLPQLDALEWLNLPGYAAHTMDFTLPEKFRDMVRYGGNKFYQFNFSTLWRDLKSPSWRALSRNIEGWKDTAKLIKREVPFRRIIKEAPSNFLSS